ncbi:AAA family ATPase [Candidatus Woesearchaeota archaeon]|nr:AAA family ATPase [Candidatus Woesearchaeota archaeon]
MRTIAVVSGKGGAGKTTTALNLAAAFQRFGRESVVVDAHLRSPHIGILLGAANLPITLHDVLANGRSIFEAVYQHPSGVRFVPAALSGAASLSQLRQALQPLEGKAEKVILDTGYDEHTAAVLAASDEILVVTNPDLASVTGALQIIKEAEEHATVLGVVVNRTGSPYDMSKVNIEAMLEYPVLVEIPEHQDFRMAMHERAPLAALRSTGAIAAKYHALAELLI